ncbi:MFS transporter [Aciditerrimonas ferrireducens]|uniref:MFS transporter n=1 Tax=Aciditerrimonas ferrireducens TaxID=667306 RepID=UPI002005804F|nr:MFS transporter [Aciditerrimonas ferrireducens]MCK4176794.1 MFS transporter [Aciditerrimonas ferrireducens]
MSERRLARWRSGLVHRELTAYPGPLRRAGLVVLVVACTVVLYQQQYVQGAVSPSVLAHFGVSFRWYLTLIVVTNLLGALASLLAGLADRVGRANLVVAGLALHALLTAFAIPAAPNALGYGTLVACSGIVEGAVLVATPALVRDFSPQVRRGTAMGLWTLGPVLGSLVVAEVASNTLPHLHAWQDQFHIAGLTGAAVALAAFLWLRELSPGLRDQRMRSAQERALVEARARGIDLGEALRHPWRQMARTDVLLPAFGVSVFLLIYYAAVGFFVIYFTSVFGYSQAQANSLGNWFWAADALAVVASGVLADRLGVRKPLIVGGALVAVVMTLVFASRATDPATTPLTFVLIISVLSLSRGFAYAPWMAAFTETVEQRNPALVATGLAIWGWVLRLVVAASFLVLPLVVSAVTPVTTYGPTLAAIRTAYPEQVATLEVLPPAVRAGLRTNPPEAPAVSAALATIGARFHLDRAQAVARLLALRQLPAADRAYLQAHGPAVTQARARAPGQWRTWWWICAGGQLVFIPTVLLLRGRWRPSAARRDQQAWEAQVAAELARLRAEHALPEVLG